MLTEKLQSMKKIKIAYWIVTILFAGFMLFSAIPDMLVTKEAHDFMTAIGFQNNFTMFIGIAKILGVIAILVPGFPRLKEWAYAGLCFDLVGAAVIVSGYPDMGGSWVFMLLPLTFCFGSYFLYHQKQKTIS